MGSLRLGEVTPETTLPETVGASCVDGMTGLI